MGGASFFPSGLITLFQLRSRVEVDRFVECSRFLVLAGGWAVFSFRALSLGLAV